MIIYKARGQRPACVRTYLACYRMMWRGSSVTRIMTQIAVPLSWNGAATESRTMEIHPTQSMKNAKYGPAKTCGPPWNLQTSRDVVGPTQLARVAGLRPRELNVMTRWTGPVWRSNDLMYSWTHVCSHRRGESVIRPILIFRD